MKAENNDAVWVHPPAGDVDEEAQADVVDKEESGDTDATLQTEAAGPQVPVVKSSGPPPNGGLWAWLQVVAAFSIFFNTWGVLNTFGIFQTYYETGALFSETSSNIAWIGAIQAYCTVSLGLVAGPIYDRGHLSGLLIVGTFLVVFGFMMLSICTAFWQVVLAQGFCVGIGAGMLFVPSLALLPTYFSSRLGLAVGLAASGSSLGGVVYPIVFYRLIGRIGFGWTVRVIAFISLATLLVPLSVARQRVRPSQARALLDWTVLRDLPFLVFTFATLLGFNGLYVMLFYLSYYAGESGSTSAEMAFYIVPILNAASMFGRTIPNYVSDKTGPINLFGPAAIVCSVLTFCMIAVKDLAGVVVVAILFGFFSGVFIALPGVCFVHLTADKSKLGTRMGIAFATLGFGVLTGGPGTGAIIGSDDTDLHWTSAWVFGGCTMAGSAVMLIALRLYLTKGKLAVKI
ncbi:major facilitator superfamily transporter monocarboxylate [Grosmannia clavigera kw1407]|uniref:Major facilitator superfamily transporter monocarboxylate n=1 Tax=Grosmannia clavigera (strain kw1407 / UAMH 11150) TaxID=655863 RepID=F0XB63_GROCL|nr:major facilitator superfamily transporter monocarboxylate [Grosmannia clavigera kw1407]EFX05057.1 major facilitator superfamily transporter monocarboxylate [Grosmannia clavigera kw1407]